MGSCQLDSSLSTGTPFNEVLACFFEANSPETVEVFAWKIFQCWTINDCDLKADISNENLALFLDQLMGLVNAAYSVHQENIAASSEEESAGDA